MTEHRYVLRVFCDSGSVPELLEDAVQAVESVLERPLAHAPSGVPGPRRPKNRKALIKKAMATKGDLPLLVDEDARVSSPSTFAFLGPGKIFQVMFDLKLAASIGEAKVGVDLLVKIARALRGHWGFLDSPANFSVVLGAFPERIVRLGMAPPRPPGLPTLATLFGRCPPALPTRLGWINYWSRDAAIAAGLDETTVPSKKSAFPKLEPLDDGSCLVRVIDEPLDPWRPAHAKRLAAAYKRFPRVGQSCD